MNIFDKLRAVLSPEVPVPSPADRNFSSAVLVLLSDCADPDVVLTTRSSTVHRHRGQVCLPGGHYEPGDPDLIVTALRETQEEVGVAASQVKVLGTLPARVTVPVSRSTVTTVVGMWDGGGSKSGGGLRVVDPAEVSQVHRIALSTLADPQTRVSAHHPNGGRGAAFDLPELFIWGFTGHILDTVLSLGGWERPWDTRRIVEIPTPFRGEDAPTPEDG